MAVFHSGVKDSIVLGLGNENLVVAPSDDSFLGSSGDNRELAKKIGELALAEVNLFKNTYNVTMYSFMDKVKAYLESNRTLSLDSKYSIMETGKPEILKLLSEQGYFKDATTYDDLGSADVIIPVPEDIMSYLYAQETIFIGNLEDLKSKYSAETFASIWSEVLTNVSNRNDNIDSLLYGGVNKMDRVLILLSFVNYIIENGKVGEYILSAAQLNVIKTLKYNLFVSLKNASESFDKGSSMGLLITDISVLDSGITNIYVDKDVYDKFLEEGGSVECLLGFFLTKFTSPSNNNNVYKEVLEDKSRLEAQYSSLLSSDKVKQSVQLNEKARLYYSIALSELYRDFSDEVKSLYVPDVNIADGLLEEVLSTKNSNEQLNVENVTYDLFRKIAVMKNYVKFMDSMSSISQSNPDLDSKQCASLAFVDLVLGFVLDQLSIVKYNKIQGKLELGAVAR